MLYNWVIFMPEFVHHFTSCSEAYLKKYEHQSYHSWTDFYLYLQETCCNMCFHFCCHLDQIEISTRWIMNTVMIKYSVQFHTGIDIIPGSYELRNTQVVVCLINTLRPRQMDAILQTPFSNAYSWMKMFEFWLKFHWSLFPRVQLTIFQQSFR